MSRVVWVAVGAVGGVIAYRKGQRVADSARERSFLGNIQAVAGATATFANGTAKVASIIGQPVVKPLTRAEITQDSRQDSIQITPIRRTTFRSKNPAPVTAMTFKGHKGPRVVDVREPYIASVS